MTKQQHRIEITTLCRHYQVERTFFSLLSDIGLIETITIQDSLYVDETDIRLIDKIIRLHRELNINPEGIDVIINLLDRIDDLEQQLTASQNRLGLYENN
ncbi:hypothetical protein GCM10011365_25190 [Marinicella pacifica]|uniref:MerR family transcriptional regulator n=1 Tax=Marinicella pacifica TaxID=1171543 RepID=A0A917CYT3_9GAMM|nr:chaperone modulator CbpM [Marinicella pacifica]GGG02970.1 hypothetical protein GCM10011365_25190 [Marinicella pacifica]